MEKKGEIMVYENGASFRSHNRRVSISDHIDADGNKCNLVELVRVYSGEGIAADTVRVKGKIIAARFAVGDETMEALIQMWLSRKFGNARLIYDFDKSIITTTVYEK